METSDTCIMENSLSFKLADMAVAVVRIKAKPMCMARDAETA